MIQNESRLRVTNNSGARKLLVIRVMGGPKRKTGSIGGITVCAIRQATPGGVVERGDAVKAVIVRAKSGTRREDGSYIKFGKNAAVAVNADENPRGTRIFGPVARELHEHSFVKVVSLTPGVL